MNTSRSYRILCFVLLTLTVQIGRGQSIDVAFGDDVYTLQKAGATVRADDPTPESRQARALVAQSFENDDYDEFRQMYLDGECVVSLKEYVEWRELLKGVSVTIDRVYVASINDKTYYIVAYDYLYDVGKFRLGIALKKTTEGPKFLSPEESISFQPQIVFFSLLDPEFVAESLEKSKEDFDLNMRSVMREDGVLDATLLLTLLETKYTNEEDEAVANEVFMPYFTNVNSADDVIERINRINDYINALATTEAKKTELRKMTNDYLIPRVIVEIAEITGKPESDVFQDLETFGQ